MLIASFLKFYPLHPRFILFIYPLVIYVLVKNFEIFNNKGLNIGKIIIIAILFSLLIISGDLYKIQTRICLCFKVYFRKL